MPLTTEPSLCVLVCRVPRHLRGIGVYMWRSGDSLKEKVPTWHCAGPGNRPKVTRLSGRYLYTLRRLTARQKCFFVASGGGGK